MGEVEGGSDPCAEDEDPSAGDVFHVGLFKQDGLEEFRTQDAGGIFGPSLFPSGVQVSAVAIRPVEVDIFAVSNPFPNPLFLWSPVFFFENRGAPFGGGEGVWVGL